MKKIICLFGIGLMGLNAAKAQHISLGPEAGLNLYSISERFDGVKESNRLIPGFKIGGVVDFGLTRHFSIQPGMFFTTKGAMDKTTDYTTVGSTTTSLTTKDQIWLNYFEIPVNFLYKSNYSHTGRFFAGGGPYMAALLGGKIKNDRTRTVSNDNGTTTTHSSNTYSVNIGDNPNTDDVRGGDVGINMQCGYEFRNGLLLRYNLGLGIANVMPAGDSDNSMHNIGMSFTVGYLFRVH